MVQLTKRIPKSAKRFWVRCAQGRSERIPKSAKRFLDKMRKSETLEHRSDAIRSKRALNKGMMHGDQPAVRSGDGRGARADPQAYRMAAERLKARPHREPWWHRLPVD
jgi:hypothetical protein